MVTFNVNSLDFVDDEEVRTGADDDFATRFDSTNSRLEIEDITNATVGYVPRNVGTDLVGGRYAETLSEGKVLADDGNVYDAIQPALDSATDWIRIGPGRFAGGNIVDTAGMTIIGSGKDTLLTSPAPAIRINGPDATLIDVSADIDGDLVQIEADDASVISCKAQGYVSGTGVDIADQVSGAVVRACEFSGFDAGINPRIKCEDVVITSNVIEDSTGPGITSGAADSIFTYNYITNSGDDGIYVGQEDCLIGGNLIRDSTQHNIRINATDTIVFNNRLSNAEEGNIDDSGTGTVLDGNLTTGDDELQQ